jgi:hypothetical protein
MNKYGVWRQSVGGNVEYGRKLAYHGHMTSILDYVKSWMKLTHRDI